MICSTTKGRVSPENLGTYTNWIKGPWIKLISSQEGFKGTSYMTKPNGEWMVLKLWETEAHDEAWSENQDHKRLAEEVMPLFVGDVERNVYEVREHVVS
jgi:heme-degrading monooxygenase HmoA